MSQIRKVAEPQFCFSKSDAACMDKKVGRFLAQYVDGDLPALKATSFEEHAENCTSCRTALSNWRNLSAAVHYFGIDPLPALRKVPLVHKA